MAILAVLQEQDREVKEVVYRVEGQREMVIERIRHLLEEGKIFYKSPTVLALKR